MSGGQTGGLSGREERFARPGRLVPHPETIQAAGVMLVVLAMLVAELASLALALKPGSEFLWWLNLQLFRGMNAAYSSLAAQYPLGYHVTIPALLGLAALTAAAYRRRQHFALGMLSNAAFVWCGFTAYVWYNFKSPLATAGLGDALHYNFEGWLLMGHLVLAALLGFMVTQLLYWRAALAFLRRRCVELPATKPEIAGTAFSESLAVPAPVSMLDCRGGGLHDAAFALARPRQLDGLSASGRALAAAVAAEPDLRPAAESPRSL